MVRRTQSAKQEVTMYRDVVLKIAVILLQISVMIQDYYEIKENHTPPWWVFVPRLIAVTFPVAIFLIGGEK